MLVNCTQDWPAATSWSFDKFLTHKDGLETWRTDYISNHDILQLWGQKEYISGQLISQIIANNGSVRLFEVLGRRRSKYDKEGKHHFKTQLMKDYARPTPIPEDLYHLSGLDTDYQWAILRSEFVLMSPRRAVSTNNCFSQADTGTSLHLDPDYTVAWNTVLSGVKLWSVLPLDMIPVSPDQFSCQPSCSQVREGEISTESWFSNILPQLMNRTWYGRKPILFFQNPGRIE